MGVGAGLYMCDVVKKLTFAISSPDEFLLITCKNTHSYKLDRIYTEEIFKLQNDF